MLSTREEIEVWTIRVARQWDAASTRRKEPDQIEFRDAIRKWILSKAKEELAMEVLKSIFKTWSFSLPCERCLRMCEEDYTMIVKNMSSGRSDTPPKAPPAKKSPAVRAPAPATTVAKAPARKVQITRKEPARRKLT